MPLLLKCEEPCKLYLVSIPCSAANHSAAVHGRLPCWACRRFGVCLQQCVNGLLTFVDRDTKVTIPVMYYNSSVRNKRKLRAHARERERESLLSDV
jgi:hypothetical protein